MSGIQILVGDHFGVYVPKRFADVFGEQSTAHSDDLAVLSAGPEHAEYWDTWNHVLSYCCLEDIHGTLWQLHQDGDLFAYCVELMTETEYEDFFGESREVV